MYKTMFSVFMLQLIIVFHVIARDGKMSLSHDDYENWKTLTRQQLSPDGNWASWEVNPQQGDGMLYLRELETGRKDSIARGSRAAMIIHSATKGMPEGWRAKADGYEPAEL